MPRLHATPAALPRHLMRMALLRLALGTGTVLLACVPGSIALGGLGLACLLHVPLTLRLRRRALEGFGNQGLDREIRLTRLTARLLVLLGLGMALASAAAFYAGRAPEPASWLWAPPVLGAGALGALWWRSHGISGTHPSLAAEARRARALAEAAGLVLLGAALVPWFPWADAAAGLALALRLTAEARTLAALTAVKAACGGCGGGCGCG